VGRARRVLAVARAEQCAHRESVVAGDRDSRAQWDATPNPWFSNQIEDREHATGSCASTPGTRDSVEFEYRFQTAGGEFRWMGPRPGGE
jgi:hypothetical protein